jgi:UDPglucose--hexose-1-phosphate uridylyltransferase
MPEFRKDPVVNRWVIIATERANRPQESRIAERPHRAGPCPFCSGNETMTPPEILAYRDKNSQPNQPGWTVRVVPNMYPALLPDEAHERSTRGFYETMSGAGVHEVIIEVQEHATRLAEVDDKQVDDLVKAYHARMVALRQDKRWRHVLLYKNEGAQAGATFEHLHSQLVAMPVVPREVGDELEGAKQFYEQHRQCVYCAIINADIADGSRIVIETDQFVALCPYAARFSFETWIVPKRHDPYFESASELERGEFALTLRETLIRLDRSLDHPSFNYVLHSGPSGATQEHYYHWHLEIMPRMSGIAGFEWGSGFFINTAAPEDAARLLREALR